ncbi:MAG: HAD-IC family P-type ATPase, partial [Gammaproteobacteria bacterium]|nr:HAD-IC family P-type ATPase [Gammaproteobacteria bacterium]
MSNALAQASVQAFVKLQPQLAIKSPVMLVVWVGTLLALGMTANSVINGQDYGFELASSLILFFTLWFANFAEAIAEARGRGQAASLKATRRDLTAQLLRESEEPIAVSASQLKAGDKVLVEAGQFVPADGEIILGVATINESALTGESAPVLREAGTDHSGVIAGTKVLNGTITVMVTAEAGHSFLDKMISLVEGTNRQKTPNELALTVLLAALTLVFLIAVATLPAMAAFVGIELDLLMLIALVVCLIPTTIAGLLPAIGIAGMNRALAANVIAKSGKAVEVAGDIDTLLLDKTGTITFGDRQATAFFALPGVAQSELVRGAVLCSVQDPTPEGKSVVRLAQEQGAAAETLPDNAQFIP